MAPAIGAFLLAHWDLLLLVATWAGIGLVAWRRRRDWRRKQFTRQVNFSLSFLEKDAEGRDRLTLRTLLELPAAEVWLNEYGVRRVQKAAERTTLAAPFVRVEPSEDMELVKHAVLNVLSERYSDVFLAQALGLAVHVQSFLFGVTWERYGDIKTHKLRVMVARALDLEALFGPQQRAKQLSFATDSHRFRLSTLESMHRIRASRDPAERAALGEIELGVAAGRGKDALRPDTPS